MNLSKSTLPNYRLGPIAFYVGFLLGAIIVGIWALIG